MTLSLYCGPNSLTFVRPDPFYASQERVISSGEEYFSFGNYQSSIEPACSSFTYTVETSDGSFPAEVKNSVAQPELIDSEHRIYLESSHVQTVEFFIRITEDGGYSDVDGPLTI